MAVLVPKLMLLFCCVGGFWLDSFVMVPTRSRIVFVVNFVTMLFFCVCFVFIYLFVYAIVIYEF